MGIMDKLKTGARDAALAPFSGLYALGGAINEATGGDTRTFSIWKAARGGGSTPKETSGLVQAASLVRGQDVTMEDDTLERQIRFQLPVVNPAGSEIVGDVVEDVGKAAGDVAESAGKAAGDVAGGAAGGIGSGLTKALPSLIVPGLLLGAGAYVFFQMKE